MMNSGFHPQNNSAQEENSSPSCFIEPQSFENDFIIDLMPEEYNPQYNPYKKSIIILSGNIGAGKTSLLKSLLKFNFSNVAIKLEAFDKWNNSGIDNLLQKYLQAFNQKPNPYTAIFQEVVRTTFLIDLLQTPEDIIITERSIFDVHYVFERALYEDGHLDENNYKAGCGICSIIEKYILDNYNVFHYFVTTDPDTCFERIHKRQRPGESNYSKDYLNKIHILNQEMFWECASLRPSSQMAGTQEEIGKDLIGLLRKLTDEIDDSDLEEFSKIEYLNIPNVFPNCRFCRTTYLRNIFTSQFNLNEN